MKKTGKISQSSSPASPKPAAVAVNGIGADVSSTPTGDQMQQLAQSFHDISDAIGQIRLDAIKAGASLTDAPIVQLQGYVFSLKNISDNLAVQAANLTLQNVGQILNQISAATETADHALDKLAKIDKAVQIASAVIVLGAAITTDDPSQIANAAKSVITTCGVSVS